MIGRGILIVLATALGLFLLFALLVGIGIFRVGPHGLEFGHNSTDPSVADTATPDGAAPREDLWAKAYRERQEKEKAAGLDHPSPLESPTSVAADPPAAKPAPAPPTPPPSVPAAVSAAGVRIAAGHDRPVSGPRGAVWEPDSGFEGGAKFDRGAVAIENTQFPDLYRCEHYGMTAFRRPLPNGRYRVDLHFAETYPAVTAPGQRVFGMDVQDQHVDRIDLFQEAGGQRRALVKTFHVTVADGTLHIAFKKTDRNVPEINGIEIVPEAR